MYSMLCRMGTIFLLALAPAGMLASDGGGDVSVRREGNTFILENGEVSARFGLGDGSISQRFFARKGNAWELVAEAFHTPAPYPQSANLLLNTSLYPYRYLANDAVSSIRVRDSSKAEGVIELHGKIGDIAVNQLISLKKGDRSFYYTVSAAFPSKQPKVEYLLSAFTFNHAGAPEFVHTPTLKYNEERWETPAEDQILGDRSFHSPAIVLQQQNTFVSLVPDLRAINDYRVLSPDARRTIRIPRNRFSVPIVEANYTMPTGLDLNVRSGLTERPLFFFGYIDNIIQHHIRFLHPSNGEMARTVMSEQLTYAFNLFVGADRERGAGFQDITRFIWQQYGHKVFTEHGHLAMPFEEYVKTISAVTFSPMADQPAVKGYEDHGSYLEFDMGGQQAGGFRSAVPGWTDALWNSVFWNNARDAVGMHYWGTRLHDTMLVNRSRRMINLLLMAPQNGQGLFPLIYRAATRQWQTTSYDVVNGKYGLFSAGPECETYDITAMSKTCAHMLDYYNRCEKDPRILTFTQKYADWLSSAVHEDGTLVSYISTSMEPSDVLRLSAQPAASMWFLAELYGITGKADYLKAAERIAAYLQREILPAQKWIDLEQYFSCGIKSLAFTGDAEQGEPARGNLSAGWASEAFASLYTVTGKKEYLSAGERCIDYLTFTQCSWNPHYIYTAYPFGGFSVDNADHATYLDARQAEYVKPLIWYGKQLGREDLLERGVAAARASVVLINHPLHKMNGIYIYTNIYPFGLGPENIDHEGHPQSAMRTHAGWGEGSGIFTGLSDASSLLEGAFADLQKRIYAGADGLVVEHISIRKDIVSVRMKASLSTLEVPWHKPYRTAFRIEGLPDRKSFTLELNGVTYKDLPASLFAALPLTIFPSGKITVSKQ